MALYPGAGLIPGGSPVAPPPGSSASIDHLLNATVEVYRPTFSSDGRGGRSATFSYLRSTRAKVGQPNASEGTQAGRHGATLMTPVHFAAGEDVRRGDELEVGGPRRLRVVDVVSNSRATYTRADCEVVQGGP